MRIVVVLVCLASFLFLVTCSSGPEPRRTGKGSYSGSSYSGTTERPRKYRRSAPTSARSDGFSTSGSRSGTSRVRGDYAGYASAERFVARMAREEGFDPRKVANLLSRAERKQWIIDLVTRPKSKRSTRPTGAWTRYRAKFLTSDNISNGARFWRRYKGVLNRASRTYGVPPEYMVAIIGVETRYGGYMGKERIMDALVTLAFDFPRRSKFFTDELAAFLVMARDEGFDPFRPRGSYAGAMGYGQFMPSSFHKWAVDFDGDGRRDLWDPVDAIGSVANYFAAHGWRRGQPVITRARRAPRL